MKLKKISEFRKRSFSSLGSKVLKLIKLERRKKALKVQAMSSAFSSTFLVFFLESCLFGLQLYPNLTLSFVQIFASFGCVFKDCSSQSSMQLVSWQNLFQKRTTSQHCKKLFAVSLAYTCGLVLHPIFVLGQSHSSQIEQFSIFFSMFYLVYCYLYVN